MVRHRLRRRLTYLLLAAAVLTTLFWWENSALRVESFSCPSARLPAGFAGFRIVVLSDLHGRRFGKNNTRLIKKYAPSARTVSFLPGIWWIGSGVLTGTT